MLGFGKYILLIGESIYFEYIKVYTFDIWKYILFRSKVYTFLNQSYMAFLPANKVLRINEIIVIGPTPPGTGEIYEHLGATSSNLTSPVSLNPLFVNVLGTRVVPTSNTTAPSLNISPLRNFGTPNATIRISALRHISVRGCE